jgi:hypothetical protein
MTNAIGDSPVHGAVARCHLPVAEVLLENGASVNQTRRDGTSPLFLSVDRCDQIMVEFLISRDANLETPNKDGVSPLYHAATKGNAAMTELLLNKGANVSHKNRDGDTPLHVAAAFNHRKAAEILVAHAADVLSTNRDGVSPRDFAVRHGHNSLGKFLESVESNALSSHTGKTLDMRVYRSHEHAFALSYPSEWRVLSWQEISSVASGSPGERPSFVTLAPDGSSFAVTTAPTERGSASKYASDPQGALETQYREFVGRVPLGWKKDQHVLELSGERALETILEMPMQGKIFIQRHICIISRERAYLLGATSTKANFEAVNDRFFEQIVASFSTSP